jgi:hypothetical protein
LVWVEVGTAIDRMPTEMLSRASSLVYDPFHDGASVLGSTLCLSEAVCVIKPAKLREIRPFFSFQASARQLSEKPDMPAAGIE